MPVSPDMAEDLAAAVSTLYEQAELAVIEKVTRALAQGLDSPLWAELKLRAIGSLRTAIEDIIAALQADAAGAVHQAVAEAYDRGRQAAVAELGALSIAAPAIPPGTHAVDRLASALVQETGATHARILRTGLDVYRQVVAKASSAPLLGASTRREAAGRALAQFADRGVTGFVDRSGRAWNLTSYVEMATRSAVGRAAVQAHDDRLAAAGIDLVMVSDAPEECPKCEPWEGKILRREGAAGAGVEELEHATEDDRMVRVRVAGSLPEAKAAGLMHPNCRHSISIYLPGVTKPLPPKADRTRATYEQSQQQRYYERQVRSWKRRAAGAIDDEKKAQANAKVRAYQGRIRELVADTGLPRKSHREQLTGAR
ncbi:MULTISPECIES: phage minor capsid protein [unclassified Streptomyces]|uniref:phage minor capsid protein n=1 Tax=unclassified Streptomyces TaxID=2593676 RepID=UPI00190B6245|nr:MULTISPECIES: phage minor capsid protein [unclassified Streptomyces]MBK3563216.1 capsid protein [Streptomyces sp. MBT62]MBK6013205.1 capsid protein [Streptomyces sp. MBT53]